VEVEGGDPSFHKYLVNGQCRGSGAVTGTATFCLSGTGTVMHSGSGSGTGFIPRSNIQKSKIKYCRPTFWDTMLFLALKRQNFVVEKLC
jgi:hypothetical protein